MASSGNGTSVHVAGRLSGMPHKKARHYLEVVRQRHSAAVAASKLSVAKRTGKFSTWSDDAAIQQVAANRERTVSSSTGTRIVDMRIAMIPNQDPEEMVRISVAALI